MCQKKRETCSQAYAWVSVSRKQMSKFVVIAYKLTHMLMHVLTHAPKFGSKSEPGNTEPNTKHMSKFGVITTAEWYNIVSFCLMLKEMPNDRKS